MDGSKMAMSPEKKISKRWQCTVCGYIHTGPAPPETCPVCGADRSRFVPLPDEQQRFLPSLISTFKLHPVAAHFPGGLLPTAVFFLFLHILTGGAGLEAASYWLILVATAVAPVSLASGLYDWRKYFHGRRARIFTVKIVLAVTLFTLGILSTALRSGIFTPWSAHGWQGWLYGASLSGMLACVVLLGHYGAILAASLGGDRPTAALPGAGSSADGWSKAIVAQAPDAILAADPQGVIRLWNHGAERIFGVPAAQAIGQSLDLIIPENLRQRHWEGWGQVMRSGRSRYGEAELLRVPAIRSDGTRLSAEFSIVMLTDDNGALAGVAAVLRDVTAQWEREKGLKKQLEDCLKKTPA